MKKVEKKKKHFWADRKPRLGAVILLALTMAAMLFIVTPFEIYCNNLVELSFSVKDFIGMQILFAFILAAIIFCVLFFIPKCVYDYAYPIFVGLLFMFFLQGNYLNVGVTSLAGDQMGDKTSTWTYIWNTSLWVLIPAGFVVAFKLVKQVSITSLVALVLTVVVFSTQLMNFSVGALTTKGAFDSAVDRVYGKYADKPKFLTNKNLEKVATDKNVVVFCVDRFDAILYADSAMEEYPESFAFLNDGFTYYNDMLSRYGYTFPSVGYMMSGFEYDHENEDHSQYFQRVYHENKTLSVLHEKGYNIHFYGENYYTYANANELPNYIGNSVETDRDTLKVQVRKPKSFALAITKMSLFRNFPFLLKNSVGGVSSNTCNEYILYTSDDLQGYKAYSTDIKKVYNQIKKDGGTFLQDQDGKNVEKNFSFIHVAGCHNTDYNKNWEKRKNGKDTTKKVLVSAKLSMDLISEYIDNMKELGVYENSTIVILGDHGKTGDRLKNMSAPMVTALFVKPAGVTGANINEYFGDDSPKNQMRTSNAPVAQSNLWATIFESEGLLDCKKDLLDARSVFDIEKEFDNDYTNFVRYFDWTKRFAGMTYYDLVVYSVNGSARDFNCWKIESEKRINHPLFMN